ncbi:Predicted ATPase [Mycobacteroides abscessus]|uniref:ATP-binding protein n=1 Tax=Mycobacteroides abscessus TaxID=36809 RepID=UPI000314CFD3|nr:ATP-binding protein [Mycobacteroides abscessus]CPT69165.1 Predicted ATPase [Mycobacteroides abscessus]CPU60755.1 Predicted ATPase [Mycobacteroides abscessus]SKK43249.1 Predicted ATPase [Mycobacteroides abscessus subsp. massiliense]SKP58841.1 Predicted ATPase [Mycobacteroides abscessus subsp. massiliense]SKR15421.1 Predicted ATPase [Mycobacteroides abscessus subsp. massiliense]
MQPSPYTPGQVAREVVGRAEQLAEIGERLMYMTELGRLIGRIRVDTGPRGVGKTSLLREVQRAAEARGVVTVWVTAGGEEPLTAAIATQIRARTAGWKKKSRGRLLRAIDQVSITAGVPGVAQLGATVKPAQSAEGASPEPSFKELIVETVKAARDEGHRGLVLLIDEVQDADRQGLRTLAVTWQDLQAEADALPAGVFAAGLPQTPEIISAAATFSERFAYRTLHRLGPDASRVALVKPAGQVGVDWAPDALEAVIAQTNGYPHTLQLYADAAWARAGYPDPGGQIGMPDVEHAARQVAEDMDALFRARWNNATPVQRRFMTAMARSLTDDRVSSRSDIAAVMGRDSRAISAARAGLIDKGLIAVAGHGLLEFSIPGFAEFVHAQEG